MRYNTQRKWGISEYLPSVSLPKIYWKAIDELVNKGLEIGVCPWTCEIAIQDCAIRILEQLTDISPFPKAPQPKHLDDLGEKRCLHSIPSNT